MKYSYKRLVKKYRKQLKKQARYWAPYDFDYLIDFMRTCVEGIKEYYEVNLNVFAEDTRSPNRKEIATKLYNSLEEFAEAESDTALKTFCDCFYSYVRELWD